MTGNFIIPLYRASLPLLFAGEPFARWESEFGTRKVDSTVNEEEQRITFRCHIDDESEWVLEREKNTLYVLSSPLPRESELESTDSSSIQQVSSPPVACTPVNGGRFRFRNNPQEMKQDTFSRSSYVAPISIHLPFFLPSFLPCFLFPYRVFLLYLKADDPRRCRWHVDNDTPQLFKNE